jgi:uncharacterized protein (DUF169 family)
MDIDYLRSVGEELERKLRLKTYPLAVKMITEEEEIPAGAKRPIKDFGYHFDLCQAFASSRRDGVTMALNKNDNWCCEPVIGYGLAEPPNDFMDGKNRFPQDVASLEAGSHYAQDLPKLEPGKYVGVLSAPLSKTSFIPDVVVIYGDSEQLSLLLLAEEYKDGHDLAIHVSSHAACIYAVVPSMKSGQCSVSIPCRGDHYGAMAGDSETIFTIPLSKLEDVMDGLHFLESTGSKLPRNYRMRKEPEKADSYMRIARQMGMLNDKK